MQPRRQPDLLIHNDVDLDPGLCTALEDLIQSPFLMRIRRPAEEELWREPPVGYVDDLLGLFQSNGDGPHIVERINIPLDPVTFADGGEGLKPVGLGNGGSFAVRLLFVRFIMAMIGVDDVEEFADFVLEMRGLCLKTLNVGVCFPNG